MNNILSQLPAFTVLLLGLLLTGCGGGSSDPASPGNNIVQKTDENAAPTTDQNEDAASCTVEDMAANPDVDQDGISNDEEQVGWTVSVEKSNGVIEERNVASDPCLPDTDGDGVDDAQERRANTDPISNDTDSDGVPDHDEMALYRSSPIQQDTDGDGLDDHVEIYTHKSSPTIADTDGDGYLDGEELDLNHHLRIADLPHPRVRIEGVDLALDVEYAWQDEFGSEKSETGSFASTLSQSSEERYATSDENSTKATVEMSAEIESTLSASTGIETGNGASVTVKGGLSSGLEAGHTSTFSQESLDAVSKEYARSFETSASTSELHSLSRTVKGGNLLASVYIENMGDTSFVLDALQLAALNQDPKDRSQFSPVAALTPAADPGAMSLGPAGSGTEMKGPFVFDTEEIFATQVEDLLKHPRGLVVKLANSSITDNSGRNLAQVWETVKGRTAGLTIDFGDGRVEKYRVATNNLFDASGQATGITMREALEGIIGYEKDAQDGYGTTVIQREVDGQISDVEVLTRFGSVEAGKADDPSTPHIDERHRFWVVLSEQQLGLLTDFDEIPLNAGDYISLAYVQDQDRDGLYAREEYLYGSSDRSENTDGCWDDDPSTPEYEGSCPLVGPEAVDLLTDWEEIRDGWIVAPEGRASYVSYSDPTLPDSDGDGLTDHLERICGLDARRDDTDWDGIADSDEVNLALTGESCVFDTDPLNPDTDGDGIWDGAELDAGKNPNDPSDAAQQRDTDGDGLSDWQEQQGAQITVNGTAVHVTFDENQVDSDADGLPDLLEWHLKTNPRSSDTDGDGLTDHAEFNRAGTCWGPTATCQDFEAEYGKFSSKCKELANKGYNCWTPELLENRHPTNPTRKDSDGDGLSDKVECLDGATTGDIFLITGKTQKITVEASELNPLESDTDGDGWTDGFEVSTSGTNPAEVDTDGDGTNDNLESSLCVTEPPSGTSRCRKPHVADRIITVHYTQTRIMGTDCDPEPLAGAGDWKASYRLGVQGNYYALVNFPDLKVNGTPATLDHPEGKQSFVGKFNDTFSIAGFIQEIDGGRPNWSSKWAPKDCADCAGWLTPPYERTIEPWTVGSTIEPTELNISHSENCGGMNWEETTVTIGVKIEAD